MEEREKYWQQIRQYVRDRFGMPGGVYDIVFLIGVREMGYGFQQLDQDTKTKVFNFASIYLMNFMSGEERREIQIEAEAKAKAQEEEIYKQAIINYFREKKII